MNAIHRPRRASRADLPRQAVAYEPLEGRRLLASTLLLDALPGPDGSRPAYCGEHEGNIIFATAGPSGTSGTTNIWRTDGTPEGTRQVGTITASISRHGEGVADAVVHGGQLYFRFTDPSAFSSPIGVMDLGSGALTMSAVPRGHYVPSGLGVQDGFVTYTQFFRVDHGFGYGTFRLGGGMIRADSHYGEYEGFVLRGRGIRLQVPVPGDPGPVSLYQEGRDPADLEQRTLKRDVPWQRMIELGNGNLAIFAASPTEVWRTDGTHAGTRQLADVDPMATFDLNDATRVALIGHVNGRLVYVRETPEHGTEVWTEQVPVSLAALPPAPTVRLAPGMDTGASPSDRITNNNRPTFTGTAAPGSTVTLYVGGAPLGSAIAGADGTYSLTAEGPLYPAGHQPAWLGSGEVHVRVGANDAAGNVSASDRLTLTVDIGAPQLNTLANFSGSESRIVFSLHDLTAIDRASLTPADLVLVNLTTGQTLDASMIHLETHQNSHARPTFQITATFPRLPGAALPAGQYRLTVAAGALADIAGNALAESIVGEFTVSDTPNNTPRPALVGSTLWVNGSASSDTINIARSPSRPDRLVVSINGMRSAFDVSAVNLIRAVTGDGDDQLFVKENAGRIAIGTSVIGGAGNDTIYTASGRDTLYGLGGNDVLFGGDDIDRLYGGDGNDHLIGGLGRDIIYGNGGVDLFSRIDIAPERRDLEPGELIR